MPTNPNVIQIRDNEGNALFPITDASLITNMPGPEIFWATYGTTTAAEIVSAYNAGKIVFCFYQDYIYTLQRINSTSINFGAVYDSFIKYLTVNRTTNDWAGFSNACEFGARKKQTLVGNETSESAYPSTKATYDAIHPAVATTQPNGGFLPNIVYDLGTLTGTVTFALATPSDANIANAYHWTFDTGSTAPTITWPSELVWADGSAPTVSANSHYEIMVRNHYATAIEFALYSPGE